MQEDKELHFAALSLPMGRLGWVHAKPNNSTLPQAALRTCRRLQTQHNLLASSLHDDGESFYVIFSSSSKAFSTCHMPVLSFGQLLQILAELNCAVLDSSEADEGVPLAVTECALKLALRVHLNQRGWFGVDSCVFVRAPIPQAFPPVGSSALVDAVEMVALLAPKLCSSSRQHLLFS
jgi:hypothetical protein